MNAKYITLARAFHADRTNDAFTNHKTLAKERLEADSTFRTGIQTSLGEFFAATPRETSLLIERILLAERKVSRLWNRIPGVMRWDYIRHSISEELFATNDMEGVRSTRKETQNAVAAAQRLREGGVNAGNVRFSEFAKLYLGITDGNAKRPSSIDDIREIYDKVVSEEVEKDDRPDGRVFRKKDVEVIGRHGTVIHNGVSGEANIAALMAEMLGLAVSPSIPRLQSAIMSHFVFEYVHPFYDGNGRTGRYLLALYLSDDLTLPTVLSLSRTIAQNKNAYYKAFSEAEDPLNCGELTFFVNTLLGLIEQAQSDLIDELGLRVDKLDDASALCNRIRDNEPLGDRAATLLYGVMQAELFDSRKSITLQEAAEQIGLSKQSARKYVEELLHCGLVDVSSGRPLRISASERLVGMMMRKKPDCDSDCDPDCDPASDVAPVHAERR